MALIQPYQCGGVWVIDRHPPGSGLSREPLVADAPEVINHLVRDIPRATNGFRLLVCVRPFPGHQYRLTWIRAEGGGHYYRMQDPALETWLCPAFFEDYGKAPEELYVKAEPKS